MVVVNADTPYAYQKLLEHTPSQADPMFVFCFFWIKVSIGVRVHCFFGGYMTCMGDTCIYYVYIYIYIHLDLMLLQCDFWIIHIFLLS